MSGLNAGGLKVPLYGILLASGTQNLFPGKITKKHSGLLTANSGAGMV